MPEGMFSYVDVDFVLTHGRQLNALIPYATSEGPELLVYPGSRNRTFFVRHILFYITHPICNPATKSDQTV